MDTSKYLDPLVDRFGRHVVVFGQIAYSEILRPSSVFVNSEPILNCFDNTDGSTNLIPKMGRETLINGYKHILETIYSPRQYYERITVFLQDYKPGIRRKGNIHPGHLVAFLKTIWSLGIKEKGRRYYWRLFLSTLLKNPRSLPLFISLAIQGFHFRKVAEKVVGQSLSCVGRAIPSSMVTASQSNFARQHKFSCAAHSYQMPKNRPFVLCIQPADPA